MHPSKITGADMTDYLYPARPARHRAEYSPGSWAKDVAARKGRGAPKPPRHRAADMFDALTTGRAA